MKFECEKTSLADAIAGVSRAVTMAGKRPTIYISQISATTLKKRSGYIDDIKNI